VDSVERHRTRDAPMPVGSAGSVRQLFHQQAHREVDAQGADLIAAQVVDDRVWANRFFSSIRASNAPSWTYRMRCPAASRPSARWSVPSNVATTSSVK
jgi:hypothetical protein